MGFIEMKLTRSCAVFVLACLTSVSDVTAQTQPSAAPGTTLGPAFPEETRVPATRPPPPDEELTDFTLNLRIGATLTGAARDSMSCEGSDCLDAATGSDAFTHRQALVLGAEFLWQPDPLVRLGPQVLFTNRTELDYDDAPGNSSPAVNAGSMLSFDLVVELSPRLSPKVWLLGHAKAGLSVLYPSSDLERYTATLRDDCEASGTLTGCESLDGARLGPNLGIGLGGLFSITPIVRLRADAVLEAYTLSLANIEAAEGRASLEEDLYGGRLMLLGGVELGLRGRRR